MARALHGQVIWLLAKGWRTADIAEAVGYTVVWIPKLCHRCNDGGPDAITSTWMPNGDVWATAEYR